MTFIFFIRTLFRTKNTFSSITSSITWLAPQCGQSFKFTIWWHDSFDQKIHADDGKNPLCLLGLRHKPEFSICVKMLTCGKMRSWSLCWKPSQKTMVRDSPKSQIFWSETHRKPACLVRKPSKKPRNGPSKTNKAFYSNKINLFVDFWLSFQKYFRKRKNVQNVWSGSLPKDHDLGLTQKVALGPWF